MNTHISDFMRAQTVMTIATSKDNVPHCATCFYVFLEESNTLVFKSKSSTRHIREGQENSVVGGSILPDKFSPGKTSGIQYYGIFRSAKGEIHEAATKAYYKKYPFAAVIPGQLWVIELTRVVFTDATLGFGKRRHWENKALKVSQVTVS